MDVQTRSRLQIVSHPPSPPTPLYAHPLSLAYPLRSSLSLGLANRILCCVVVCTRQVVRWCDSRCGGDHIVSIPVSSRRPVAVPRDSPRVNRPRLGRLRRVLLEKLRRERGVNRRHSRARHPRHRRRWCRPRFSCVPGVRCLLCRVSFAAFAGGCLRDGSVWLRRRRGGNFVWSLVALLAPLVTLLRSRLRLRTWLGIFVLAGFRLRRRFRLEPPRGILRGLKAA
mmetsp:Transcript_9894/g.45066  ORF Transcript_9894/g.45066 Transcript_9894/m.45066 type:complete len:225 (+) Transcript_9894:3047-3721(+)